MRKTGLPLFLLLSAISAWAAQDVRYPEDFRDWHHVTSMVISQGHPLFELVGGMHHIYANPQALKGYKVDKFPAGAVIVFDLFEAKAADNAIAEGAHKAILVMEKDPKRFAEAGGWGFGMFDPKTRKSTLSEQARQECVACHSQQKDSDYVFSRLRQ